MHWRIPGAQSVLHLRALYLNGDWESLQQYRIEQQCQKPCPYKDWADAKWNDAKRKTA